MMGFVLLVIMMTTSIITINARGIYKPPIGGMHTFTSYGYVKDTSGNPIRGATVRVTYGDPATGIYRTATTSSSGYYSISVTTSLYVSCTIRAYKSGYYSQTKSVYSKGTRRIDFSLTAIAVPHTFTCYGYVRSVIGTPIEGVTTKLQYGSTIYDTDVTGSNGYYYMSISTTLYRTFSLKAEKSGYVTQYRSVYSSGTRRVDVTLVASDGDKYYEIVPKFTREDSIIGGPNTDSEPINLVWYDATMSAIRSFFTENGWRAVGLNPLDLYSMFSYDLAYIPGTIIPIGLNFRIDASMSVQAYDGNSLVDNYQSESYIKNSEYHTICSIGYINIQIPIKRDHFRIWDIEDSNGDNIVFGSGTYDDGVFGHYTSALLTFLNDPFVKGFLMGLSIVIPPVAFVSIVTTIGMLILDVVTGQTGGLHMISLTTPWRTAEYVRDTWIAQSGQYSSTIDRLSTSVTWSLTGRTLTWSGTAYDMY